jgi:hypothetical protein
MGFSCYLGTGQRATRVSACSHLCLDPGGEILDLPEPARVLENALLDYEIKKGRRYKCGFGLLMRVL